MTDAVSRRSFMQLVGGSAALAGMGTACMKPNEKIIPFVRRPEDRRAWVFYAMAIVGVLYNQALFARLHLAIPVIITDSFGRPWREGLTEVAIGIAGIKPLRDDRGRRDPHGYKLNASVEAVADELACAAGLVCGKLNRAPACIVRGFRYDPGPGKVRDLLRPAATDLFR